MTAMRSVRCVLSAALLATALSAVLHAQETAKPARDVSLLLESRAGVKRALDYLAQRQGEDGSWMKDPAITGLVVIGMVGSGEAAFRAESEPVAKGLAFIRKFAQPDGGIYAQGYANYTTSICSMALIEAGRPEDVELIRRARGFLLDVQADESEDIKPDDLQYGGWGYEKDAEKEGMHRADMSNTQLALEAIHALQAATEEDAPDGAAGEGGASRTELAFQKALVYLQRCQSEDGGFIYRPDESKAGADEDGALRSYGGMTYAGLKSMIYARVDRNDPRVRAAYDWARTHWTVTENPCLGRQGLFYHYQTMAKGLNAYGEESIVDGEGKAHDWREELVSHLLKIQAGDGSWVNDNGRWMETIPELATAYTVLAIEQATSRW